MSRKDELKDLQADSLLYGVLAALLSDEKQEAIEVTSLLLEKLKEGNLPKLGEIVDVTMSFVADLHDLGYIESADSYEDDDLVEFEIKTIKDEDPKKKLN